MAALLGMENAGNATGANASSSQMMSLSSLPVGLAAPSRRASPEPPPRVADCFVVPSPASSPFLVAASTSGLTSSHWTSTFIVAEDDSDLDDLAGEGEEEEDSAGSDVDVVLALFR